MYRLRGRQLLVLTVVFFSVTLLTMAMIGGVTTHTSASPKEVPIYAVETKDQQKLVSLTINCAWGNEDIPSILDTLKTYEVTATFFLVGDFVEKFPDSVTAIADAGHELGNHSDTHADFATLSAADILAEVDGCNQKIEALTGTTPTLVRPPSGSYNNTVVQTIRQHDMEVIQWSLDSLDWKGTTPKEMQSRILPNLTYGDILLFHNDTDYTAEALTTLIPNIQAAGYTFVPVGELLLKESSGIDHTGRQLP